MNDVMPSNYDDHGAAEAKKVKPPRTHLNLFVDLLVDTNTGTNISRKYWKLKAACVVEKNPTFLLAGEPPEFFEESPEPKRPTCKACEKILSDLGQSIFRSVRALATQEVLELEERAFAARCFAHNRELVLVAAEKIVMRLRSSADDIEARIARQVPRDATLEQIAGATSYGVGRGTDLANQILHDILWLTPNLGLDDLQHCARLFDNGVLLATGKRPSMF